MQNSKPKKIKVTLEDVLDVMEKGFVRIEKQLDKTATKEDIKEITDRLDILEHKTFSGQNNRIERLEDDVRKIKTHMGCK